MTSGPRHRLPWALALLPGLLAGACAHAPLDPADTLTRFGSALEKRDDAAAYALMSSDYQKRVPLADFRGQLDRLGPDAQAMGRRLREAARRTPVRIEVEGVPPAGDKMALRLEGEGWRVEDPPLDPFGQKTPRAALRSFVRGLEQKRYDVILKLVPNRYRASTSVEKLRQYWEGDRKAENQKLLRQLGANLKAPIIEIGDEARMPYDDNAEVRLVREDGAWKIDDPE